MKKRVYTPDHPTGIDVDCGPSEYELLKTDSERIEYLTRILGLSQEGEKNGNKN